jgi:hypothetical protein
MSQAPGTETLEAWPTWTDFVDNWRAVDAHWIRDRVVNLFDDNTKRAASNIAPLPGTLSFLQSTNSLEFYKSGDPKLAASWESVRYPNLAVSSDATTVTLRQTAAGSGIILGSDGTGNIEKLNAGLGTVLADVAGVTLKVGAKTVVLATNAAGLTVDSPVSVTGTLSASGALTAASAALSGAVTAASAAISGILSGGTVNGGSGLIGGVTLSGNRVTAGTGAAGGMVSGSGHFYGDASSALMRHSSDTGPYLQVTSSGGLFSGGGQFDFFTTMRMLSGNVIQYYYNNNTQAVNIPPSFYAASDPGAGNFPDGTIWIN